MSRKFREGDRVILVEPESGESVLVECGKHKRQTRHGEVDLSLLVGANPGQVIETSRGVRLVVLEPDLRDILEKGLERGPQIVQPKDAGVIITYCSITRGSRVLEAGTGSGFLAIQLASRCKELVTYENRPEHYEKARRNIEESGLTNIEPRLGDVRDCPDDGFDAIVLDLKDAHGIVPVLKEKLRPGGRMCVYCPVVEQVQLVSTTLKNSGFLVTDVLEVLARLWKTGGPTRPEHVILGHTGFLVFARRVE